MELADVVIVGAGPAGLVLALSLAQHAVKCIVLEKEQDITQDPRGVYLAGDAARILWSLGLAPDMPLIGHELQTVMFHTSSFAEKPFHTLDMSGDTLQQAVPTGILQVQPQLEAALRKRVLANDLCDFRPGCTVTSISEHGDQVELVYTPASGAEQSIRAAWLVGADGKRGVVRKTFLEKIADIRQVDSDYRYEGTWIAANLQISLPTAESHPEFPAWQAGMTPEDVYDLYWPKGWHFCSPPGKPAATGRFGPHSARLWRHELRQDDWDSTTMDAEELFWENLTPMITRSVDLHGKPFSEPAVYPRDCITVLRCRPFTFTHKLVNKWFHRRTVLIGDAAHVFPPFGGQGIASGVRDAHQLSWRIAAIVHLKHSTMGQSDDLLTSWSKERTSSVKSAAFMTKMNGMLCNDGHTLPIKILQWVEAIAGLFVDKVVLDPQNQAEKAGFTWTQGGFFLPEHSGGRKLPQIYLDSIEERQMLSDGLFKHAATPLRLLIIVDANESPGLSRRAFAKMLAEAAIPDTILSPDSVALLGLSQKCRPESIGAFSLPSIHKAVVTPVRRLGPKQNRPGYTVAAFPDRLGARTRFAIVRADFYVFAAARNPKELHTCVQKLGNSLHVPISASL